MSFVQALQGLLGGPRQREDYQDFVNRYGQGHPSEGYPDQEVADRYNQIAPQLPAQDYQQAAMEAFERMSPEEREQFARHVQERARERGVGTFGGTGHGGAEAYRDPGALARMTGQLQQEQPDFLGSLLGQGGALGSPIAKAALAGVAAMAAQRFLGSRGRS
jgi:hypothetical protein